MATYEEIYGKRVKEFDSDPTLDSSYEGQVWYNSATGTLKSVVAFAAWSSGSNLNTARNHVSGAGTQTAGLAVAGDTGSDTYTNAVEEYNGSGWSTGGNYPGSYERTGSSGTQTAAITAGGYSPNQSTAAEYNGTSWTAANSLSQARYDLGASGTQTAGLFYGGSSYPPTAYYDNTEEYDGTNWTNGGSLNTARAVSRAGAGIQTASITASGRPTPSVGAASEQYNGNSWTTTSSTNETKSSRQSFGSTSSAILTGGTPTPFTGTEEWDGSSWSTSPASLASNQLGAGSTKNNDSSSGGIWGGGNPSTTGVTQEYNKSINTITAAAWSSGGAYPTATEDMGSAGTRTAGLIFGGRTPAPGVSAKTNE